MEDHQMNRKQETVVSYNRIKLEIVTELCFKFIKFCKWINL